MRTPNRVLTSRSVCSTDLDILIQPRPGTPRAFAFGGWFMGFDLTSNMDAVMQRFEDVATRQMPFALSRALNATAQDVRAAEVATMSKVFDRPTPYTLNAFQIKPSTKADLVAVVEQKEQAGRRDYLKREAEGGPRQSTALEKLLRLKLPISGMLTAILPADNARLDSYGNWSNGQRNEVLAAVGAMRDSTSNRSAKSVKRKKNPSKFFVPTSGLPPAIYERTGRGQLKVILAFTAAAPVYTPRFPFQQVAEDTAQAAFPAHFAQAFAAAASSST